MCPQSRPKFFLITGVFHIEPRGTIQKMQNPYLITIDFLNSAFQYWLL